MKTSERPGQRGLARPLARSSAAVDLVFIVAAPRRSLLLARTLGGDRAAENARPASLPWPMFEPPWPGRP